MSLPLHQAIWMLDSRRREAMFDTLAFMVLTNACHYLELQRQAIQFLEDTAEAYTRAAELHRRSIPQSSVPEDL